MPKLFFYSFYLFYSDDFFKIRFVRLVLAIGKFFPMWLMTVVPYQLAIYSLIVFLDMSAVGFAPFFSFSPRSLYNVVGLHFPYTFFYCQMHINTVNPAISDTNI